MAGFSLDIIGMEAVTGRLAIMQAEVIPGATAAVEGALTDALDASLPLIPVRTGRLLGGQQTRLIGGGVEPTGELYNDTPYARWVNSGHHTRSGSWVPAQDFMTAPMEVGRRSLMRRMAEILLV
jgi:hypothetical protein